MVRIFRNIIATALLSLAFASCQLSTSQLEKEVKNLVNEKMAGTGVRATNINLVHEDGNKYTGQITLVVDGEEETFSINVISDGRSFQYAIPELIGE